MKTRFLVEEPDTCRQCGGIVRRQNPRCNRCGAYVDASAVENAALRALVPDALAGRAATFLITVSCVAAWLIIGLASRGDSLLVSSAYTLTRFGATQGGLLYMGELWRLFTSIFLHHDILHLGMNLYALQLVGSLLEERVGRHRTWSIFVFGGGLSMAASWLWYVYSPWGSIAYLSAGASGGVTALIGACWYYARNVTRESELERGMLRWSALMLIFGLIVSGVNNAAHIGGWVAGAGMAMAFHRLPERSPVPKLLASAAVLVVLSSAGTQTVASWGHPPALEAEYYGRSLFMLSSRPGVAWERSSNLAALTSCRDAVEERAAPPEEALKTCRYMLETVPHIGYTWYLMARAYHQAGMPKRAERAERILEQLDGR